MFVERKKTETRIGKGLRTVKVKVNTCDSDSENCGWCCVDHWWCESECVPCVPVPHSRLFIGL